MRAIFVSYRRDDAEGEAGRLFGDLAAHFGEDSVFMDVAAIEVGRDFRKAIDDSIATCGVLLAVIGKGWTDTKNEAGQRRLDDPFDFVRLETASALKRDIPVVPVLVHGAKMPRADQLPDDLKELAYRNGVEVTHARWNSDLQLLFKALRPFVEGSKGAPDTPSTTVRKPVAETKPPIRIETRTPEVTAQTPQTPKKKPMGIILAVVAAVLAAGAVGEYMMLGSKKAEEEQRVAIEQKALADKAAADKAADDRKFVENNIAVAKTLADKAAVDRAAAEAAADNAAAERAAAQRTADQRAIAEKAAAERAAAQRTADQRAIAEKAAAERAAAQRTADQRVIAEKAAAERAAAQRTADQRVIAEKAAAERAAAQRTADQKAIADKTAADRSFAYKADQLARQSAAPQKIPNFGGTWELASRTDDGQPKDINGSDGKPSRTTYTQNGAVARNSGSNWPYAITSAGIAVLTLYGRYDNQKKIAWSEKPEAEAEVVYMTTLRLGNLEGAMLVIATTWNYKTWENGKPPHTVQRILKYKRVS